MLLDRFPLTIAVEKDHRRRRGRGGRRRWIVRHSPERVARQREWFSTLGDDGSLTTQCCSPDLNGGGGWGIFSALFGWTNSATYGTVISYNLYWLVVILAFLAMRYNEKAGHWPFLKAKAAPATLSSDSSSAVEKVAVSGAPAKTRIIETSPA